MSAYAPNSGTKADVTGGRRRARRRHRAVSFDHLVGKLLQLQGYLKAKRLSGREVDNQIELLWPLYRQVIWLGTVQNLSNIFPASSKHVCQIRPIRVVAVAIRDMTSRLLIAALEGSGQR